MHEIDFAGLVETMLRHQDILQGTHFQWIKKDHKGLTHNSFRSRLHPPRRSPCFLLQRRFQLVERHRPQTLLAPAKQVVQKHRICNIYTSKYSMRKMVKFDLPLNYKSYLMDDYTPWATGDWLCSLPFCPTRNTVAVKIIQLYSSK